MKYLLWSDQWIGYDDLEADRHRYNCGASTDRTDMINAVKDFCGNYEGTVLDASDKDAVHMLNLKYLFRAPTGSSGAKRFFTGICDANINSSLTAASGCRFTTNDCRRILRSTIDEWNMPNTLLEGLILMRSKGLKRGRGSSG
ncbi:hypothetical protein F5Y01DRAFT_319275 [Xylaria sp. FL0043]|nr:hypothetical protein F5Y01DRAFT_319275 [Xylaria sp. FL0043]